MASTLVFPDWVLKSLELPNDYNLNASNFSKFPDHLSKRINILKNSIPLEELNSNKINPLNEMNLNENMLELINAMYSSAALALSYILYIKFVTEQIKNSFYDQDKTAFQKWYQGIRELTLLCDDLDSFEAIGSLRDLWKILEEVEQALQKYVQQNKVSIPEEHKAMCEHISYMKNNLENYCGPNAANLLDFRHDILFLATVNGFDNEIDDLLETNWLLKGSWISLEDKNASKETPLFSAMDPFLPKRMELLIKGKANVNCHVPIEKPKPGESSVELILDRFIHLLEVRLKQKVETFENPHPQIKSYISSLSDDIKLENDRNPQKDQKFDQDFIHCLKLLLENNAQFSYFHQSRAIRIAALYDNIEIVQLLCQYPYKKVGSINDLTYQKDKSILQALPLVVLSGQPNAEKIVDLLLEKDSGAGSSELIRGVLGEGSINYLADLIIHQDVKKLKLCFKTLFSNFKITNLLFNIEINQRDLNGRGILEFVIYHDAWDCIPLLREFGADFAQPYQLIYTHPTNKSTTRLNIYPYCSALKKGKVEFAKECFKSLTPDQKMDALKSCIFLWGEDPSLLQFTMNELYLLEGEQGIKKLIKNLNERQFDFLKAAILLKDEKWLGIILSEIAPAFKHFKCEDYLSAFNFCMQQHWGQGLLLLLPSEENGEELRNYDSSCSSKGSLISFTFNDPEYMPITLELLKRGADPAQLVAKENVIQQNSGNAENANVNVNVNANKIPLFLKAVCNDSIQPVVEFIVNKCRENPSRSEKKLMLDDLDAALKIMSQTKQYTNLPLILDRKFKSLKEKKHREFFKNLQCEDFKRHASAHAKKFYEQIRKGEIGLILTALDPNLNIKPSELLMLLQAALDFAIENPKVAVNFPSADALSKILTIPLTEKCAAMAKKILGDLVHSKVFSLENTKAKANNLDSSSLLSRFKRKLSGATEKDASLLKNSFLPIAQFEENDSSSDDLQINKFTLQEHLCQYFEYRWFEEQENSNKVKVQSAEAVNFGSDQKSLLDCPPAHCAPFSPSLGDLKNQLDRITPEFSIATPELPVFVSGSTPGFDLSKMPSGSVEMRELNNRRAQYAYNKASKVNADKDILDVKAIPKIAGILS